MSTNRSTAIARALRLLAQGLITEWQAYRTILESYNAQELS